MRKRIVPLTDAQKQKYRVAIKKGFFDIYEKDPFAWRKTLVGSWIWKYPERTSAVERFRDMLGREPQWEDLTSSNLRMYRDTIAEYLCQSSVKVILAELKSVINENVEDVSIPAGKYAEILSVKKQLSQAVYLSEEEIERIDQYEPQRKNEYETKKYFMIECLTGARSCDAERLSIANVNPRTNMLTYVSQKTNTEVSVPVHHLLPKYLAMTDTKHLFPMSYSRAIIHICKECGIDKETTIFRAGENHTAPKYEFVSSHTGRRSFATNLYLADVDIDIISNLMGHSSIEMTRRYIVAKRPMDEKVYQFFKQKTS